MKKKDIQKLTLSRETVVLLTVPDLRQAMGGGWSDDSVCPTVTDTTNRCH